MKTQIFTIEKLDEANTWTVTPKNYNEYTESLKKFSKDERNSIYEKITFLKKFGDISESTDTEEKYIKKLHFNNITLLLGKNTKYRRCKNRKLKNGRE